LIESYNRRAVELWGREPRCGDKTDRFCGSYRIYTLEGTYLPHDQCPMAQAIYTNNAISNAKIVIERPDGSRRTAMVNIIPRRNAQGRMTGAINCLTDITELKEAEERISASLREKETLLKEIHHRVKNNLQVLYSLLTLQANLIHSEEALKALNESRSRVMSISLIHEQLYRSEDLARIDFAGYVDALTAQLFRSYGVKPGQIERRIAIDRVLISVDQAIPAGLIINELVSNALKYAFPANWQGALAEITVSLFPESSDMLVLTINDTGIGLPLAIDLEQPTRLGLQLVTTLTRQLRGTLTLDRSQGTTFRITFPG
jgi:two-component sensor histidine kinase